MDFLSSFIPNKLPSLSPEETSKNSNTTLTPSQKKRVTIPTNMETTFHVALKDAQNFTKAVTSWSPFKSIESVAISATNSSKEKEKNEVRYSDDKIIICRDCIDTNDSIVEAVEIPKKGFFRAGPNLRRQIEDELFEIMISETLKAQESGADATRQQKSDQGRNTSMVLKDSSSSNPIENKSPTLQETSQFFKGHNYDLSVSAGSLLNQTLGHTCLLLFSEAPLPKLHEQKVEGNASLPFECLDGTGAIGFPLALMSKPPTSSNLLEEKTARLEYEAEKIHSDKEGDSFLIKYTQEAQSFAFYLRDNKDSPALPSEHPSQQVLLDDSITQSSLTTMEIKLTPNPHFDNKRPQSRENFPCLKPECLDLRNSFTTGEKPQPDPQ